MHAAHVHTAHSASETYVDRVGAFRKTSRDRYRRGRGRRERRYSPLALAARIFYARDLLLDLRDVPDPSWILMTGDRFGVDLSLTVATRGTDSSPSHWNWRIFPT